VALSPTISKKKKETTKSLKSFEKNNFTTKNLKNCCQAATKPRPKKNKTNPPTGYPVSKRKNEKKIGKSHHDIFNCCSVLPPFM